MVTSCCTIVLNTFSVCTKISHRMLYFLLQLSNIIRNLKKRITYCICFYFYAIALPLFLCLQLHSLVICCLENLVYNSFRVDLLMKISQFYFIWECLFHFYFWRIFLAGDRILGWQFLFFLHLKNIVPLPLGSMASNEFTVNLSPVHNIDFLKCQVFPSLVFRSLIIMCLGIDFFGFTLFRVYWAFWMCKFMPFANFGIFSANISSTFSVPHSLFYFWDSKDKDVRSFITVS